MKILIHIQSNDNKINPISLESIGAAQQLKKSNDAEIHATTFSSDVATELNAFNLDKTILIEGQNLDSYNPLFYLEAFDQIIENNKPDLIIFGHTYETRDWVPRLSARKSIPFISDCIGMQLGTKLIFTRSLYQNKVNVDVECKSDVAIVSFQSGSYKLDSIESGSNQTEVLSVDLNAVHNKIKNEEKFKDNEGGVDLTSADFIVSIGRGIGKEENIPMARELSDLIGAQLASSRPVVDSGWVDHSLQIGSSGQIISPKLYLALGISGAIQHVVGMKSSQCILSINKDKNAPIFEISDYGVVGDIMEIIPKLNSAIKEHNG